MSRAFLSVGTRTTAGATSAPAASTSTPTPDTGWVNLGTYRSMVHDRNTVTTYIAPAHHGTGIIKKYWDHGEPCRWCSCPAGIRCSLPWERRTRPTA